MDSKNKILVYLAIKYNGDFDQIYDAIKLGECPNDNVLDNTIAECKSKFVTILDDDYPDVLKRQYKPPIVLFYYGDISLIKNSDDCLSVVGSRKYSDYGEMVTRMFVSECAKKLNIVSGLALGIDTIAHEETIKCGGKTVAVLGSGIDYCYPISNKPLYEIIKKDHLLISEHPGEYAPKPENFPIRNRIIAALSKGILIPEGKTKSGTQVTASYATFLNKDLYCVPTTIEQDSLCNDLIAAGAYLVKSGKDVLELMGKNDSEKVF